MPKRCSRNRRFRFLKICCHKIPACGGLPSLRRRSNPRPPAWSFSAQSPITSAEPLTSLISAFKPPSEADGTPDFPANQNFDG